MNEKTFLYAAYGSNMNHDQMSYRCPDAEFVSRAWLNGWSLEFRGVADIIESFDDSDYVPVGVWRITERCLASLDQYEGYPSLYGRRTVTVEAFGDEEWAECIIYYMNHGSFRAPSYHYYAGIVEGYKDCGQSDYMDKLSEARDRAICESMGILG